MNTFDINFIGNRASKSIALLFVVLSVVGYKIWCRQARRQKEDQYAMQMGCKAPQRWAAKWPQGLDLLLKAGQHARAQTILQFFLDVVESSGPTHEQQLLGSRGINTVEPRNIEEILSTQFEDFSLGLRPKHFAPLMGSGIFTQDGAAWKHSRALLRPQFTSNRYQNFEEMKKSVESLIDQISSDSVVDLQPLFFRLTFDTTTFLLFGKTLSSLQSSDIAGKESEFATAFNLGQDYLSHRGRLGDWYWLANTPEFWRACKTSHRFVDDAIQNALDDAEKPKPKKKEDEETKHYVFIDALIQETRNKKELRDQCLNVLLAGRDTTACCLTWTLRLLARHPQVLQRLRTEIEEVVGLGQHASQPTRVDLKKMQYLDLVLKEVLRLYPSVPVNSRAALKTTTLPVGGGPDGKSPILVRKGEAVGYCVYAMHRRTDIYGEDALEFRPERWEDGQLLRNVGYGYLPFNGGPRVCLGQEFALLEAGYTVARLVQKFPFLTVPHDDPVVATGKEKQVLTLVVASGDGCRVHMRS
ncbi:CypX Cytochrome P450 [Pyrenophora tritici-repentis]|uniref:CypX, Cytochrome P450 n=1 Tax=Pyrenophora tritici-repentis TaxID=45151 RepID=A0A2W1EVF4_9PLEO|nr:cytochrome p450 alkane [Pyrenophora tritici-repentis]KAF7571513.1 CypX, Cytochrome P450 [Pyrenophora tritici-repentis]KAI0571822.1 cytochrome p450 alkane [Pyrenophora tritici-repentis]KAI0605058.1 cytochrome p450 alkane [Pyrenophora tritici-repentis]KAI0616869.1 cytochrome p450 alkane [Pyrenophora tritici-repentis]